MNLNVLERKLGRLKDDAAALERTLLRCKKLKDEIVRGVIGENGHVSRRGGEVAKSNRMVNGMTMTERVKEIIGRKEMSATQIYDKLVETGWKSESQNLRGVVQVCMKNGYENGIFSKKKYGHKDVRWKLKQRRGRKSKSA